MHPTWKRVLLVSLFSSLISQISSYSSRTLEILVALCWWRMIYGVLVDGRSKKRTILVKSFFFVFFFLMERNLRTNNKDTKGEIKANTAMEIVHTLASVIKWEGKLQTLVWAIIMGVRTMCYYINTNMHACMCVGVWVWEELLCCTS